MGNTMKELLELAQTYFAASGWWPVIRATAALAIIASLVRVILSAVPWMPALLVRVGSLIGRTVVACAGACRRALRDALTYKHATEPRWVKPLTLMMELVSGAYFALLFFLFSMEFLGVVLYPPPGLAIWKRVAAAGAMLVMAVMMKVFTVQARDAWVQLRDRWRAHRPRGSRRPRDARGPQLLSSRSGGPYPP